MKNDSVISDISINNKMDINKEYKDMKKKRSLNRAKL